MRDRLGELKFQLNQTGKNLLLRRRKAVVIKKPPQAIVQRRRNEAIYVSLHNNDAGTKIVTNSCHQSQPPSSLPTSENGFLLNQFLNRVSDIRRRIRVLEQAIATLEKEEQPEDPQQKDGIKFGNSGSLIATGNSWMLTLKTRKKRKIEAEIRELRKTIQRIDLSLKNTPSDSSSNSVSKMTLNSAENRIRVVQFQDLKGRLNDLSIKLCQWEVERKRLRTTSSSFTAKMSRQNSTKGRLLNQTIRRSKIIPKEVVEEVANRNAELAKLAENLDELEGIFADLREIVHSQDEVIDRIQTNIRISERSTEFAELCIKKVEKMETPVKTTLKWTWKNCFQFPKRITSLLALFLAAFLVVMLMKILSPF